jgi:hypothetical protein
MNEQTEQVTQDERDPRRELEDLKRAIRDAIRRGRGDRDYAEGDYDEQIAARERVIDWVMALVNGDSMLGQFVPDWDDEPEVTDAEVTLVVTTSAEHETFEEAIAALTNGMSEHLKAEITSQPDESLPITSIKVTFTGPVEDIQEVVARNMRESS